MKRTAGCLMFVALVGLARISAGAAAGESSDAALPAPPVAEERRIRSSPARSTRLYVRTIPPGAAIKVDGEPRGTSVRLFKVPPGVRKMTVEVELDGHYPKQKEVEVRGGRITRVVLELDKHPRAEPWPGEALTFDFNSGPGPNFSIVNEGRLWTVDSDGPSLRVSKPADEGTFKPNDMVGGGIESNFTIDGDFVVTVDFALHEFPFPASPEQINELVMATTGKTGQVFEVLRFNLYKQSLIKVFTTELSAGGGLRPSQLLEGRYRISRRGSRTTGLFSRSGTGQFTPIYTTDNLIGPARVKLLAVQGPNHVRGSRPTTSLDVSFENLVIEADRFEGLVPAEGTAKPKGHQPPEKTAEVVPSAAEVRRFEGHTDKIYDVAYSPDGRLVASGSADLTVRLWDVKTGREVRRLERFEDRVDAVAFTPDGKHLVSGSSDATVRLWDVATGKEVRRYEAHADHVRSVAVSQDGRRILSCGEDRTLRLWDLATGDELKRIELDSPTFDVAISADNRLALSADPVAGVARLWDLDSGAQVRQFKHGVRVTRVAFTPDGRHVLSSGGWDPSRYSIGRSGPYFGMFGPGSGPFGGGDNNVRLWELATGREIRRFTGHTKPVWKMAISPDGSRILSASPDRTIRLWDLATGKELCRMEGCASDGVAFSPDGHLALGVLIDMKTIFLWRLPNS